MYARLWWKEARTFWPIWVALGVIAVAVWGLLLWFSPALRTWAQYLLISLSLPWLLLYAFAVGAAAFAGERETNTQVFLDTLPVGRRMLWTGKVSFAMATTLGPALMALILLATYRDSWIALDFGLLLFEALAWSLLWSVVLRSALQSALLGILIVGLLGMFQGGDLGLIWGLTAISGKAAAIRSLLAVGALLFSWVIYTWEPRTRRPARVRAGRSPGASRFPFLGMLNSPFGRLAWETARESRWTWRLLAVAGLAFLPALLFRGRSEIDFWVIFGVLASLLAGVSVFGPATRTQSYRFLAYHGVRPGVVWAARSLAWVVVMAVLIPAAVAVIWVGFIIAWVVAVSIRTTGWPAPSIDLPPLFCRFFKEVAPGASLLAEAFVVGLFCGQVVRRSITAWVVACLAFALLVLPQVALVGFDMIPPGGLALFPILVLLISWAWSGDWMSDLRGAGRWLRLGGMIVGALALLLVLYIGYRAWGVPEIDPPFSIGTTPTTVAQVAPDQDASPDYDRIHSEFRARDEGRTRPGEATVTSIVVQGWEPNPLSVVAWWEARRGLIEPLRRAAERTSTRFAQPDLWDSPLDRRIGTLEDLTLLLGLDNAERRSRGDLAGAWDDLKAAFRISAQVGQSGAVRQARIALDLRIQALRWALAWAADPRQTPTTLRSALADFRALPRLEPVPDRIRDEYTLIERTFRRAERDPDVLIRIALGSMMGPPPLRSLLASTVTSPWERERVRRVSRLLFADRLQYAHLEPFQRSQNGADQSTGLMALHTTRGTSDVSDLAWYLKSTPQVDYLRLSLDSMLGRRDEVILLDRAFEQVLALRIWQLEHDGHYPESLDALVPGLPPDPYSGRPFRYTPARGQKLLPLGLSGLTDRIAGDTARSRPTRPGQWLLYSVGPNRTDDGARRDYETFPVEGDLIFPLPAPEGPPGNAGRGRAGPGEDSTTGVRASPDKEGPPPPSPPP